MHMLNFEGIEQISIKLLAVKVAPVIYTGIYLKIKVRKRWNFYKKSSSDEKFDHKMWQTSEYNKDVCYFNTGLKDIKGT